MTDAGTIANRDKVTDGNPASSMRADAVITVIKRDHIFEQNIAAVAVDIVAVVPEILDDHVAKNQMRRLTGELNTGNQHWFFDFTIRWGFIGGNSKTGVCT